MKKNFVSFRAFIIVCTLVGAILVAATIVVNAEPYPVTNSVGPYLQKVSVNVHCEGSQGSGTIFLSTVDGRPSAWVITANHVVRGLREVSSVIGPDGESRKSIRYSDAQIIQEQVEKGRTIGELKYDAKIINVDKQRDIALLRVRKGDFTNIGASFYLRSSIPLAGTEIFHCGAPGGKETGGTCSLTSGIISRIGVRIPGFGGGSELGIFDQTDTAALGGSSGGMIALKSNGQWIGMITLGLGGDSFHWFVPMRSVSDWAEEIGVTWLLDPSLDRPTEEQINSIVLEHLGGSRAIKPKEAP